MAAACATADGEPYKRGDDVLTGSTGPLRMQVAADLAVVAQRTRSDSGTDRREPAAWTGRRRVGGVAVHVFGTRSSPLFELEANRERIGSQ